MVIVLYLNDLQLTNDFKNKPANVKLFM